MLKYLDRVEKSLPIGLITVTLVLTSCSSLSRAFRSPSEHEDQNVYSCGEVSKAVHFALREHYWVHEFSSELSESTYQKFLSQLDPHKVVFVDGDESVIRNALSKLDWEKPDCSSLGPLAALIRQRFDEAESIFKEELGKSETDQSEITLGTFLPNENYFLPVEKRNWAIRKDALILMTFYVRAGLSPESAKKEALAFAQGLHDLHAKYGEGLLLAHYLQAFLQSLDPHSMVVNLSSLSGAQGGIGVELGNEDSTPIVKGFIKGGPAEESGKLSPGDKIIAVSEEDQPFFPVIGSPLTSVIQLLQGKPHSKVRLLILRGKKENFPLLLERRVLAVQQYPVRFEEDVAFINIRTFLSYGDQSTHKFVAEQVRVAQEHHARAIVLDLRSCPGGTLDEVSPVLSLFMKDVPVFATKSRKGDIQIKSAAKNEMIYEGPLVVWTNSETAAGAEFVAGALKKYHRALIVGDKQTFGEGTIQTILRIGRKRGFKLTIGRSFFPDGESVEPEGVLSDVRLSRNDPDQRAAKASVQKLPQENILKFAGTAPLKLDASMIRKAKAMAANFDKGDNQSEEVLRSNVARVAGLIAGKE